MAAKVIYSKAPITEAIIAIDVKLPEETKAEALLPIWEQVKEEYPNRKRLRVLTGKISMGEELSQSAAQREMGPTATNADTTYTFQARLNGFSFHRLAPYESWEPFRTEARRLWGIYRSIAKPLTIARLAVRYVNRLDIPGDRIQLEDFLRTAPTISPELPQALAGYFMQLIIPNPNFRGMTLINEAIIEPNKPGVCSVVLDIDLFRIDDIPQDEDGIWRFMEQLDEEKNGVFEACITDRTRELIR